MAIGRVRLLVRGSKREDAAEIRRKIKERFGLLGRVEECQVSGGRKWAISYESIGDLPLAVMLQVDGISKAIL